MRSQSFDSVVLKILLASLIISLLANITSIFGTSEYELFNMAGHFLNFISYYLIYKAIIEIGLAKPYNLMFKNLKESEITLQKAHDDLELRVKERTEDLSEAYEKLSRKEQELEKIFASTTDGIAFIDIQGRIIRNNHILSEILKVDLAEFFNSHVNLSNMNTSTSWSLIGPNGIPLLFEERAVARALKEKQTIKNIIEGLKHPDGPITWLDVSCSPVLNLSGEIEGLVFTVSDITEKRRLREDLERYSRRITQAQEEERKRIARELHDDAAQSMAIISLEIDSILSSKEIGSDKSLEKLKHLKSNVERSMQDIRRYSHELHPSLLDHLGLIAALDQLVEEAGERGNIKIDFKIIGEERKLVDDTELALFRIAQESLNNIWKHARATKAKIQINYSPGTVKLCIVDNGRGFNIKEEGESAIKRGSLGLLSIKERAYLVGASMEIKSKIGIGTRVSVEAKI